MSSKISVTRKCLECGDHFTAKTTTTRFCSHLCNSRNYKKRKRNEKVRDVESALVQSNSINYRLLEQKPYLKTSELSELLGLSRSTIYNLINNGTVPIIKVGARTLIKREDIDGLLQSRQVIKTTPSRPLITSFYTAKEIEALFDIGYSWLYQLVRRYNVPFTYHDSRLIVSKPHFDNLMARRESHIGKIDTWYSIEEIMEKYALTRDMIYARTSKYRIPKKKSGRHVLVSQMHFDEVMNPVI